MLSLGDPRESYVSPGTFLPHMGTKEPGTADSPPSVLELPGKSGGRLLLGRQGGGEIGAGFDPAG